MIKFRVSLITLLILLACSASESEIVDRIVAVVNGDPITLSGLKKRMTWLEGLESSSNLPKDLKKEDLATYVLEDMIDNTLQLQEAKRLGIIITEDELQLGIAQKRMQFPTLLRKIGVVEEELREDVRGEIMIRKMVDRKFRPFWEVSDTEAATYYEQNREKFFEAEQVKVQQVLVGVSLEATERERAEAKLKANEISLKLKGNSKIDDLREVYMKDNVVIKTESDYIQPAQLLPALSNAISKLQIDEISEVIESPIGYFILKLEDRKSRRQKTFSESIDEVKSHLLNQKVKADLQSWLKEEREKSDIRTFKIGWDPKELKP